MDLSDDNSDPGYSFNPKMEVLDGDLEAMQEGCLSLPDFMKDVSA